MIGSNLIRRTDYLLSRLNFGKIFKTRIPSNEEWTQILFWHIILSQYLPIYHFAAFHVAQYMQNFTWHFMSSISQQGYILPIFKG